MTASARLALPYLIAGQAQKEITHNEALAALDMAVNPNAQSIGANDPPTAPEVGQCWIVGPAPTGAWAGKQGHLAGWSDGGWRFLQPFAGLVVWLIGDGMFAHWDGVVWVVGTISANAVEIGGEQIIGSRQPAISAPAGGGTVDVEARSVIEDILGAMRGHGLI